MAVNKDSNGYTFTFAIIMVIVVGTLLTTISMSLKDRQDTNEEDKKRMDILAALNVPDVTRKNAAELYEKYIKDEKVLTFFGRDTMIVQKAAGPDGKPDYLTAFEVDVKADYKNKTLGPTDKYYPLFIGEVDGKAVSVVPMVGSGLWGPIWGYVALQEDNITVFGAAFDHKTETPGLGAEIKEGFFEEQWIGEQIYNLEDGQFTSVNVKKGGASPDDKHAVDAITGGTITSNGVTEMAKRTFAIYRKYLSANFDAAAVAAN